MPEPILELVNVSIQFDIEPILENISLKIYAGDRIVVIGPSGAGKSVLLKTLAGIIKPSQGQVNFLGRDWRALSLQEKHELSSHVGVQFQGHALFDELSVFDNVAYPLKEHSQKTEEQIKQRVLDCLKAVNLEHASRLSTFELSGGMRLRLAVARAIALVPATLFLDDPTGGLDPVNSDDMINLILKITDEMKMTLVIVTHDVYRAYQLAGRIIFVANKSIFETGNAEQTKSHPDPSVQQFIHGWLKGPLTESLNLS